jgi:hypothetical protein
LKGTTTTTNNKGKRIFHYQLRHGIFEQDLVYAKVKGVQMMCFNTKILPDLEAHEMKYTATQKSVLNTNILTQCSQSLR